MVSAILVGTIIGFVLAIFPGPVGVTAIKLSLFNGKRSGTMMAIGTAIMDFIYSLVAIFATSAALDTLTAWSLDYPGVVTIMQIGIVVIFIILGIINIRVNKKKIDPENPFVETNSKLMQNLKEKGPFLVGITVALSCLASPTFFPSLAWVAMNIHTWELIENTFLSNFMFAVAFGFGNFLWLYLLVRLVDKYKSRFSPDFIVRVKQFAGFTFLGFGTFIGFRVLQALKIPEVIRILFAL